MRKMEQMWSYLVMIHCCFHQLILGCLLIAFFAVVEKSFNFVRDKFAANLPWLHVSNL